MYTRSALLWLLAFIITISSAVYQRTTGPSWPVRGHVAIGGQEIRFRLPRSHGGEGEASVTIGVPDTSITGQIEYRRFRSDDSWRTESMHRRRDSLVVGLPHQPPAGKIIYRVWLSRPGEAPVAVPAEPVIIRFRGAVPVAVLLPHIALMFAAILVSTRAGLEALRRQRRTLVLTKWTLVLLFFGGLILGPVVQKYAFGALWTGWPSGHDLTDNKTAVAFLFWLVAFLRLRSQPKSRWAPAIAALILLAVYLIPHSILGSELDHTVLSDQETLRQP